jgi:hypothetical protein
MASVDGPQTSLNYSLDEDPIYRNLPIHPAQHETRRIKLHPGKVGEPIKCDLEVMSLRRKLPFEAVSYSWGLSKEKTNILIGGNPLKVSVSLEAALQRFRDERNVRYLWADAISINQNRKEERNEQVSRMREIYRQCSRVLIWLGEGIQPSVPTAQKITQSTCQWTTDYSAALRDPEHAVIVSKEDEQNIEEYKSEFLRYYRRPKVLRYDIHQDHDMGAFCLLSLLAQNKHLNRDDMFFFLAHLTRENVIRALSQITDQGWWYRQWVIQETVLAKKVEVYYGRFIIPWDTLAVAAMRYQRHRLRCCADHKAELPSLEVQDMKAFTRTIREIDHWRQIWMTSGTEGPDVYLLDLLWQFRRRRTSNPRDKVYALLSLVTRWGMRHPLEAHYEWTIAEVYQDVAMHLIEVHNDLRVLMGTTEKTSPSNSVEENLQNLPSWVPDWYFRPDKYELDRLERARLYFASKKEDSDIDEVEDPDQILYPTERGPALQLNGFCHDIVDKIGEKMPDDDAFAENVVRQWHKLAGLGGIGYQGSPYGDLGSQREAWWRTLCMDTEYRGREDDDDNDLRLRRDYDRAGDSYGKQYEEVWLADRHTDSINRIPSLKHAATMKAFATVDQQKIFNERSRSNRRRDSGPTWDRTVNSFPPPKHATESIDDAVTSATVNRRFFLTKTGYMGLGPHYMARDDIVCVFAGGNTPFLVRQAESRNIEGDVKEECFRLVGDCYLHGIMDGETMDNIKTPMFLV